MHASENRKDREKLARRQDQEAHSSSNKSGHQEPLAESLAAYLLHICLYSQDARAVGRLCGARETVVSKSNGGENAAQLGWTFQTREYVLMCWHDLKS